MFTAGVEPSVRMVGKVGAGAVSARPAAVSCTSDGATGADEPAVTSAAAGRNVPVSPDVEWADVHRGRALARQAAEPHVESAHELRGTGREEGWA